MNELAHYSPLFPLLFEAKPACGVLPSIFQLKFDRGVLLSLSGVKTACVVLLSIFELKFARGVLLSLPGLNFARGMLLCRSKNNGRMSKSARGVLLCHWTKNDCVPQHGSRSPLHMFRELSATKRVSCPELVPSILPYIISQLGQRAREAMPHLSMTSETIRNPPMASQKCTPRKDYKAA